MCHGRWLYLISMVILIGVLTISLATVAAESTPSATVINNGIAPSTMPATTVIDSGAVPNR